MDWSSYFIGLLTLPALALMIFIVLVIWAYWKFWWGPFWYKGLWAHCDECGTLVFTYTARVLQYRVWKIENKRKWPMWCRPCARKIREARIAEDDERNKQEAENIRRYAEEHKQDDWC